jgi:DNA-binding SARP family transcriptional activator/predicted ATPase
MPSTPILRIHLLGEFRLFANDQPIYVLNRPREQALLAYLLLNRHMLQSRQQLAFCFWPDSSESQAFTNLRKLFFHMRQVLPNADHFLYADTQSLCWRSDATYSLDVAELEQALDKLEQAVTPAVAMVEKVVTLYRGELLPSCYDDWILPLRRALHERVVNTLEKALEGLAAQRAYEPALRAAEHLLRLDPLHEATYRQLMHLRALGGDRPGALRVYHECVTLLERELGVPPAPETRALYEHLLRVEPTPAAAQAAPAPQALQIPLVGRQAEWQTLQQAWHDASRGPRLVIVWGEAGVGKTRLVEELMRWANMRPGSVAYARTYAAEGALAYAPLTEWLHSEALHPVLSQMEKVWLTELARLLPELQRQYPDLPAPLPMSEGWQRQRFYEALARVVLAAPAPRLFVLDDLQWCDAETLAWLRYLLRFDAQAPLLVVGTVRSEAVDEHHPLHELRQQVQRAGQWAELELAPLNGEETALLAGHLTEENVAAWAEHLYRETEGNPLFVVEMLRAGGIVRHGAAQAGQAVALPPTVQAVIGARLAQLSPSARQLAQLAATIGRAFTFDMLAAASAVDEDRLVQALDELWQRRLVRERGQGYDFSHDKIRDVAYAEIKPMRRRLLHRQVAQVLETVSDGELDAASGQIAAHWEAAGDSTRACHFFQRAGNYSATRFANADAIRYFGRALAFVAERDQDQRYELLLARVKLLTRQGQRDQERADLAALQALVNALPPGLETTKRRAEVALCTARHWNGVEDRAKTKAAAQVAAHLAEEVQAIELAAQGYLMWGAAEFWHKANYPQAQPYLERALQLAQLAGLQRTEAEALLYLALLKLYTGEQLPLVEEPARQALALYRTIGDKVGEAFVLCHLAYIIFTHGEGRYLESIGYSQEALAFGPESIGWDAARFAMHNIGYLSYLLGDYAKGQTYMEQELSLSRQAENPGSIAAALRSLGSLSLDLGDYAMAQEQLAEALHIHRKTGNLQFEVTVLGLLPLVQAALGESAQARRSGEQAVALAQTIGDPRQEAIASVRLGRVLIGQGETEQAAMLFQQALVLHRRLEQKGQALKAIAGLAEVALRRSQLQQALSYVTQILAVLSTVHLDATDEVLDVFLTCYHVFQANADPRAQEMLKLAHAQLQTRTATLESEPLCKRFWSVPTHQLVLAAVHELSVQEQ